MGSASVPRGVRDGDDIAALVVLAAEFGVNMEYLCFGSPHAPLDPSVSYGDILGKGAFSVEWVKRNRYPVGALQLLDLNA